MTGGDYDAFAWVYERYWGGFGQRVLPVIDKLVLVDLPSGARILDLACGTGVLARELLDRGYAVTGVDNSDAMIEYARARAPEAEFIVEDARAFILPVGFDAAVSTYDSLNHILEPEELESVFRNVRKSLKAGGLFVFDLNMEAGYEARWRGSFAIVRDDHVVAARSRYDRERKLGEIALTLFREDGGWRRSDLSLRQRCYTHDEVVELLERAGFEDVSAYRSGEELDFDEQGRTFFVGRAPAAS